MNQKYKTWYDRFIFRCMETNPNFRFEHSEQHHIIPRCIGGSNNKDNLIFLTYEQHFVAHWILAKAYPEIPYLSLSISKMSKNSTKIAKLYAYARGAISMFGSHNPMYGRHHTEESKKIIGEYSKKRRHSEETKKKISQSVSGTKNGFYGKTHTKETREKLRQANLGRHLSEEAKEKISIANKGRKQSEETKRKISLSNKGKIVNNGEDHPGHKISYEDVNCVFYWLTRGLSNREISKKIPKCTEFNISLIKRGVTWKYFTGIENETYKEYWKSWKK